MVKKNAVQIKKYIYYILLFLLVQIYFSSHIPVSSPFSPLRYPPNVHILSCTLVCIPSGGPRGPCSHCLLFSLLIRRGCGAFSKYGLVEVWHWAFGPLVPALLLLLVCCDVYHLYHAFLLHASLLHASLLPCIPTLSIPQLSAVLWVEMSLVIFLLSMLACLLTVNLFR